MVAKETALLRCATDPNLKSSGLAKSPRPSRRNKSVSAAHLLSSDGSLTNTPRKSRSKSKALISFPANPPRMGKRQQPSFPSNPPRMSKENLVPEASNRRRKGSKRESEGSFETEATMDSSGSGCSGSGESVGSSSRRRRVSKDKESKPDMDWGSHAATATTTKGREGKSSSSSSKTAMGTRGSGHKKKEVLKKTSGHSSSKRKDGLTKGGSGHTKRVSTKPKAAMRKSLSSGALPLNGSSEKSHKKSRALSPLVELVGMDSGDSAAQSINDTMLEEQTDAEEFNDNFELAPKSFDDLQLVEFIEISVDPLKEEKEDHEIVDEFEFELDEEDMQMLAGNAPKKASKQKARRVKSSGDEGKLRRASKMDRRMTKAKSMDEGNPPPSRPRRSQVPATPKAGRKARAQSMIVRSPTQSDEEEEPPRRKERSRRGQRMMSINEDSNLVAESPRRQGRRSVAVSNPIHEGSTLVAESPRRQGRRSVAVSKNVDSGLTRRPSRQPAYPSPIDLDYGDEDDENLKNSSPRQRKVRRSSLGSGSSQLSSGRASSQQKEGNRRMQGLPPAHRDNTLNGLVTPRRPSRKLAIASPFDMEEESEDDLMNQSAPAVSRRSGQDPLSTTTRRRRDVSRRGSSITTGLDFGDAPRRGSSITSGLDLGDANGNSSRDPMMDKSHSGRRRRETASRRLSNVTSGLDMGDEDSNNGKDLGLDRSQRSASRRRRDRERRGSSMAAGLDLCDEDDNMDKSQNSLSTSRRRRDASRRVSSIATGLDLGDDDDDMNKSQSSLSTSRRRRDASRRVSSIATGLDLGDDDDDMNESQSSLNTSRRRRDASRRVSSIATGLDLGDDNEHGIDHMMDTSQSGRRRRETSRRVSTMAPSSPQGNDDSMMDISQSGRRRSGTRRPVNDSSAAGRRQSTSLRGLERLKGGEDTRRDSKSVGSRKSVRSRRRDVVDDAAVGRTSVSKGRYGYGTDERRCLSAVPSTPKKSVGLAALLYCKPLDLENDGKEDDAKSSTALDPSSAVDDDERGSPVSVTSVGGEKAVDKAQAKKDYWKAKLAAGKADGGGSGRGRRSVLVA